jgi:Flp pilus assembly pilin Flp
MKSARKKVLRLFRANDGVTIVEYAILLAMIVCVAIVAIRFAGQSHRSFWLDSADSVQENMPSGSEL